MLLRRCWMTNLYLSDINPVKKYENDDIVVTHRFIDFPNGDKEAVLGVINLKNGKGIRMETGATPMTS